MIPLLLTLTIQLGFIALLAMDVRRAHTPARVPVRIAEERNS